MRLAPTASLQYALPGKRVPLDARLLQIAFLGSFLTIGVLWRDFSLKPVQVLLTFVTALLTQAFWLRLRGLQQFGFLSALVTCFGLSILVRADNYWVHPLVACIAISSKFVLRYKLPARGGSAPVQGHLFNPANLGAVLAAFVLPGAWLSPGQWGQWLLLSGWVLALGLVVSQRAARWDVAIAFLLSYALLLAARVTHYGINPQVMTHTLNNGALLIFSFFMISDPMTTPRRRAVRIAYGVAVALGAFVWQFTTFQPHGAIIALAAASLFVPLLNSLWPAPAHQWRASAAPLA